MHTGYIIIAILYLTLAIGDAGSISGLIAFHPLVYIAIAVVYAGIAGAINLGYSME